MLDEEETGICRARRNIDGAIVSINYGKITSIGIDPIENKPLLHFLPGSRILSVGSFGCNMECPFCQNYRIAKVAKHEIDMITLTPEELAQKASFLIYRGNIGIAFTYNEPLVGYEFVRDTAKIVKSRGMKVVVVTNGFVSEAVANEVLPYVDALNIDLKCFNEEYYKSLGGDLETVKNFIKLAAQKCHIELTTLIVPGENDSEEEMHELAEWVASINENIPLHLVKFVPAWKMKHHKQGNINKIGELADIARQHLNFVHEAKI